MNAGIKKRMLLHVFGGCVGHRERHSREIVSFARAINFYARISFRSVAPWNSREDYRFAEFYVRS